MKYLKVKSIHQIKELFQKTFFNNNSHFEKDISQITRSKMFDFGTSDQFLKLYDLLALEISKKMKWDLNKIIYQSTPTFRVF